MVITVDMDANAMNCVMTNVAITDVVIMIVTMMTIGEIVGTVMAIMTFAIMIIKRENPEFFHHITMTIAVVKIKKCAKMLLRQHLFVLVAEKWLTNNRFICNIVSVENVICILNTNANFMLDKEHADDR